MKVRIGKDSIIVKLDKASDRTASGIITSTNSKDSNVGTVVVKGPLVKDLHVGDKVLLAEYAMSEIPTTGDDKYVKIGEDSVIIAILDPTDPSTIS